jgi:hypothetical protein
MKAWDSVHYQKLAQNGQVCSCSKLCLAEKNPLRSLFFQQELYFCAAFRKEHPYSGGRMLKNNAGYQISFRNYGKYRSHQTNYRRSSGR